MTRFRPCSADLVVFGGRVRTAFATPRPVVVDVGPRPDAAPGIDLRVNSESPLTSDETALV
jgi:hypothetical protein